MSDPLRLDALSIALKTGYVSTGLLVLRLSIDHDRAQDLINFLVANGVVERERDGAVHKLRPRG